jgi:hypothetical protein
MLKIIHREMNIHFGVTHQTVYEELCNNILTAMELHGMLPPHSNKLFQKNCRILQEPHGNEWDEE